MRAWCFPAYNTRRRDENMARKIRRHDPFSDAFHAAEPGQGDDAVGEENHENPGGEQNPRQDVKSAAE